MVMVVTFCVNDIEWKNYAGKITLRNVKCAVVKKLIAEQKRHTKY